MINHSNDNQSNFNELANIQENNLISATCDTLIEVIFELANRTGADEDLHAETLEKSIKQLHDTKIEAENLILNARIMELIENLNE